MDVIEYQDSVEGISEVDLVGFFEGWSNPPSAAMHLRILRESYAVVLALVGSSPAVVGFITAISDGVLAAYIPLLEVRPGYRHKGIGSTRVRRVLHRLEHLYMTDVVCDPALQPFYEGLGMQPAVGASMRRYARQGDETSVAWR